MPELNIVTAVILAISAFLCEYIDSTLGMGYGTMLTPLLIIIGFGPSRQIVPVILLSELVTGLLAGFLHHKHGNVDFKPKTADIFKIRNMLSPLGYVEKARQTLPLHLKVAIVLSLCSVIGTIAAVFVAVNIPKAWLNLYIGFMVLSMGIIMLFMFSKNLKFSWKKITILGIIASFNKGMSGGGYGPVVTGGQILSGVEGKSAVGITSLAEGITCLVGVIIYAIINKDPANWKLAPYLIGGAVLSVPLSARTVKYISTKNLKIAIAFITIVLGMVTIIKAL